MAARYLLPALAVAGRAAAASCSGPTTISTQAQATQLATCSQYNGNIVIGKTTQGDIDISGIQRLSGSLEATDVMGMTSLTAEDLSTISGTFLLDTVSSLTSLNFPNLVAVDTINWQGLPVLQGLSFTQQVQKASSLTISNTNLYSLEGIDLQEIGSLSIQANPYLSAINMQLSTVSSALIIAANGVTGKACSVSFPDLIWAYNMTIQNVGSLDIASLSYINGSLGFRDNSFTEIQAPNLTAVQNTLSFAANSELQTIDFPEITEIGGGLVVANNSNIASIDGFPRLKSIFGNIDFLGTFKSVSLPKLKYVQGAFYVQSSGDITSDCNHFKSLQSNGDIRGSFTCDASDQSAAHKGAPSGGGGSGSSGSSGSNSGHSGAGTLLIPYATGIVGIVAAIFGML